jgi:hypothetical protein
MDQIILSLISGLIGSFIGGGIAVFGALVAVKRTEFYRLAGQLKTALRAVDSKLSDDTGHPVSLVENVSIDHLLSDVIAISPIRIRKTLQAKWREYRYDAKIDGIFPTEYTQKGPADVRKLMRQRLHNVISLLE